MGLIFWDFMGLEWEFMEISMVYLCIFNVIYCHPKGDSMSFLCCLSFFMDLDGDFKWILMGISLDITNYEPIGTTNGLSTVSV